MLIANSVHILALYIGIDLIILIDQDQDQVKIFGQNKTFLALDAWGSGMVEMSTVSHNQQSTINATSKSNSKT